MTVQTVGELVKFAEEQVLESLYESLKENPDRKMTSDNFNRLVQDMVFRLVDDKLPKPHPITVDAYAMTKSDSVIRHFEWRSVKLSTILKEVHHIFINVRGDLDAGNFPYLDNSMLTPVEDLPINTLSEELGKRQKANEYAYCLQLVEEAKRVLRSVERVKERVGGTLDVDHSMLPNTYEYKGALSAYLDNDYEC